MTKRIRRVQFRDNVPTHNGACLRTVFAGRAIDGWTATETPGGILLSHVDGETIEVRGLAAFIWWEDVPEPEVSVDPRPTERSRRAR